MSGSRGLDVNGKSEGLSAKRHGPLPPAPGSRKRRHRRIRSRLPLPPPPPPRIQAATSHPRPAKLAREAADASARKRKAADGGEAAPDATAAPPIPGEEEDAAMGDVPQAAPHAAEGGAGEGPDPNPSPSLGGCSDPVSVELSMGRDYYSSCCGDADLDIPEGPKLPCVGDKEPLSSLAAEFQSGSPILQEKIKLLGEQYDALRRTRGDGNCFYRSFMFSYLEHILETQDKAEVDRIMIKIEECRKTLLSLGYIEFTFEDFFSIFIDLLESVLQGHEAPIGPEELLERTRDSQVSDYVVMFFRFVTSGEIQRRSEFFEPFISGLTNSTVAQFCKASVEPMGEESDHVHIIALSDALGVPIRVMYLDRSSCDTGNLSVNHHDFIPLANASEGDAAMTSTPAAEKPYITLLYRPGHYDILYPK
ncbi:OVARIAN TUMOR DOMAIN-containing deubiquitinating enzyme 1-like [Panicum virgatum]|nr:OVARIAN TUMOR DOMAIN-containing deubiquitinating enzyme 1-like [Panicum virgatum]